MDKRVRRPDRAADIYRLAIEGISRPVSCRADKTVLQALTDAGILLEANCGGRGVCGKCKVQVIQGKLTGPDHAAARPLQPDIYPACQIRPAGDLFVRLKQAEVSTKGSIREKYPADGAPLLEKRVLAPPYSLTGKPAAPEDILVLLAAAAPSGRGRLLRQLAGIIKKRPEQITAVLIDNQPVAIEAGDTSQSLFGIAFDIGTTTVVGMLVDLNNRRPVAVCSETNPQAAFGADVISRITATGQPGNLAAQARAVRQCLNRILRELCETAGLSPNAIYAASLAGNTTMNHLLLETSPLYLVRRPYSAVFCGMPPFAPRKIALDINPDGKVLLLPNISGFIGADTTAAILAAGQDSAVDVSLIIDLGTNGEMALGNRDRIIVCSTAAGCAFEGAHIRDGMRASAGAIDDVDIYDGVRVRTIGGGKPLGICGAGVVKAIAQLLRQKIIEPGGRFSKDYETMPTALKRRLKYNNDQWEFVLVAAENTAINADISLTQADIRQIQLAKAAICSGIQILLETLQPDKPVPVMLAGAFGNYIDIDSAIAIGMLSGFTREQVRSVGNAAGTGAVLTLLSRENLARSDKILGRTEYIELAARPDFQKKFLANLAFPEVIR